MKKNILLTITIAALTLAACNDDASDNTAASAIPLQITAVVQNGTTTRTEVTGTSFEANSSIGVNVTKGDRSNVQYTLNGTTWSSEAPIYYQDTSTKTFSAYYPYSGDKVNSEGELVDVDPDDYLFASGATGSVDKNSVSFTFYHKMSKIALTFKKGTDVTDDDFSSISKCHICGVYTKGSFNTTDGTTLTSGKIDVQEVTTSFKDGKLIGSAILYPQTAPNTDDGIYVVVKVNNVNYKTTLIAANSKLESGNVYSYTVTINKTGLTVTLNSGITAWDDSTNSNETATEYDPTFTDINQVRLYDLVMEDGRFLHVDANDDRVITDTECNQLGSYKLENVVGIVLWLGNPIDYTKTVTDAIVPAAGNKYDADDPYSKQIGDPILKSVCSNCTHGLIAGIKYAEDDIVKSAAYTYPWVWKRDISPTTGGYIYIDSDKIYSVSLNFQDAEGSGYGPSDNYLYIDGYDKNCKNKDETSNNRRTTGVIKLNVWNNLSRFMGYNNTQVIKGYAKTLDEHYFLTSCLENSYSQKISGNDGNNSFSDWFIPSMWELYVMFGGDETKSFRDYYVTIENKGTATSLASDKIKNVDLGLDTERIGYIKNITNALEDLGINSAFDPVSGIWTSTEFYCGKSTDSSPAIWFTCECDEKSNIKSTHFDSATKYNASAAKHIVPICAF
jgi:hypothetical protein